MKISIQRIKIILLLSSCFALWACDSNTNSAKPVQSIRGSRDSNPLNNQGIGNNTNNINGSVNGGINNNLNGNSNLGQIYSSYDNEFNNAVKALLSSTMDPNSIGYINSRNGVYFAGNIQMNPDGSSNAMNSQLRIEISDSYTVAGQSPVIPISFSSARSIQANGNQITIAFEDQFGLIVFQGSRNGNNFVGNVSFTNYSYFDNSSPGKQGTLGDFSIPYCSFFHCN